DRLDGLSAHAIARRGVARTFQIPRPLGRMSVLENVLVYAHAQPGEELARVFTSPARVAAAEQRLRERAHAILESVALAPLAGDRAETLSGGQKKLLELARALMSEPRMILLDEPGAGVNPTLMRSLVEAIRALRVEAGELVAVIGPNGAGKSTLLKALAGLVRPRGGRIVLRGADITQAGTRRIVESGLCYVPQEANVFPSLSVWENLTIGAW